MAIRRKRIREITQKLLNDYAIQKPPVNIEIIVKGEKLNISKNAFGSEVSGFIFRKGDSAVIGVNQGDGSSRQRFTLAHELGHYLLHARLGSDVHVDKTDSFDIKFRDDRSTLGTDAEEREANYFAAELLMPEHFIRESLKDHPEINIADDEVIDTLAKDYEVSRMAMTYRLNNLGIIRI